MSDLPSTDHVVREQPQLKSSQFRREREAGWRELEALVDRAERHGIESLDAADLHRLPILYRNALSSLSVAQAISLDRNLLDYLENLCARAYLSVYVLRRDFSRLLRDYITTIFPQLVRRYAWHIVASALFLLLGIFVGMFLTLQDSDRFYVFVSEALQQGRTPTASTQDLREVLYGDGGGWGAQLWTFATFLFTHNARIGMLAFSLGFAVGVPVFYLLFFNGLTLGALAALYDSRGLSLDFWGWVLPHAVTELFAVVLCGGAGLVVAQSVVAPGSYRRLQNLAHHGRQAGVIVLGAVVLFFLAALVEGIFRQTVQSIAVRYTLATLSVVGWTWYFTRAGRGGAR